MKLQNQFLNGKKNETTLIKLSKKRICNTAFLEFEEPVASSSYTQLKSTKRVQQWLAERQP